MKSAPFSAEREGFEPTVSCPTLVFKTSALNHSAISPNRSYFSIKNDPMQDVSEKQVQWIRFPGQTSSISNF